MIDAASPPDASGPVVRFHQVGTALLVTFAIAELVLVAIGVVLWLSVGQLHFLIIPVVLMGVLIMLFHGLTIEVHVDRVRCAFGPGLIARTVPAEDIVGVRPVTADTLNAWGIRKVRNGWLWNTSGFDAVELQLRDGRVFQMGSGRPQEVVEAVEAIMSPGAGTEGEAGPGERSSRG